MVPFGSFTNEAAFNDFLVKHAEGPFGLDPFLDETRTMMCDDHRIVFTHGDFAPRNIMVQGDVVVGVIDWGIRGIYAFRLFRRVAHQLGDLGWYPKH
jgi:aminoglycoside phosphotransferase